MPRKCGQASREGCRWQQHVASRRHGSLNVTSQTCEQIAVLSACGSYSPLMVWRECRPIQRAKDVDLELREGIWKQQVRAEEGLEKAGLYCREWWDGRAWSDFRCHGVPGMLTGWLLSGVPGDFWEPSVEDELGHSGKQCCDGWAMSVQGGRCRKWEQVTGVPLAFSSSSTSTCYRWVKRDPRKEEIFIRDKLKRQWQSKTYIWISLLYSP